MTDVWAQLAQAGVVALILGFAVLKLWLKLGEVEKQRDAERRECAQAVAELQQKHVEFLESLIPTEGE